MKHSLYESFKNRRSLYALGKTRIVSEADICSIAETAVLHTPSAFNSQAGRVVVLFGEESSKFWNIIRDALKAKYSADEFVSRNEKINSFNAGYGTILFFEDQSVIEEYSAKFPSLKDSFPVYSVQSNGMMEYIVWTSLEAEGLAASLQHYNQVALAAVQEAWGLSPAWKLLAQIPFGSKEGSAPEKEFKPLENRMKVFGREELH